MPATIPRVLAGAAALAAVVAMASTAFAGTLFADDFQDGNTTGWTTSGGSWSVVTDGSQVLRQSSTSSTTRALAGSAAWTAYSVRADVRPLAFNGTNRYAAIAARAQNTGNFYYLAVRSNNTAELGKVAGGTADALAAVPLPVAAGTWYRLRLDVSGATVAGYVDDTAVGRVTDGSFAAGRVGLATYNTSAEFDNVTVDDTPGPAPSPSGSPSPSASVSTPPPPPPADRPIGFAAVNAWGQNGTTGGAGGPVVTVRTATYL
jgi:pectate lyase